ncbi:hypothetical protein OG401_05790 [Kitasatospora purpeofusca]|uniref:hypothetical protein n=1 Tax=Kitasatospora purpeofusca TaxID=67352 RepID=UPI00224F0FDB|nr:hypothetical protein [Kitasatospora purpeofusca]MCX4683826.1 hypothetical protein [Kitasatospora purpeofusca]
MSAHLATGDPRHSFWLHVREFAVPASVIETATARRIAGDWAGACAAARVDVDLDLRSAARRHGRELADRLRCDLRALAPDLLRWHLPRVAPLGLLRPGLTLSLARYGAVHLVVRTPPGRASGGQRFSLALQDGTAPRRPAHGRAPEHPADASHPHPHPSARFRLDLHRHLWDAGRSGELPLRSGGPERWAAEARILLRAEGRPDGEGAVRVRLGAREVVVGTGVGGQSVPSVLPAPLPVLPDAAVRVPPDLELLRAGLIGPEGLHPLVAAALAPTAAAPPSDPGGGPSPGPSSGSFPGRPRVVRCRGGLHRIGLVDGVLTALDHRPDEIRREELLMELTGTPLPCLQTIDDAHRRPESLADVRARLDHGDTAGALAAVEDLLGPEATLRTGPLRDALAEAAERRVAHGLFRAGLADPAPHRTADVRPPGAWPKPRPQEHRAHPRHARDR